MKKGKFVRKLLIRLFIMKNLISKRNRFLSGKFLTELCHLNFNLKLFLLYFFNIDRNL